jgi:hypothetical protein
MSAANARIAGKSPLVAKKQAVAATTAKNAEIACSVMNRILVATSTFAPVPKLAAIAAAVAFSATVIVVKSVGD